MHSCLLYPSTSYEENKVLLIQMLVIYLQKVSLKNYGQHHLIAFFRKLERIASTVVVACSTHIPEVRGSNPATDNEREIGRYK